MTVAEHTPIDVIAAAYLWIEQHGLDDLWFTISYHAGKARISFGTTHGTRIREALAGSGLTVTEAPESLHTKRCSIDDLPAPVVWFEFKALQHQQDTRAITL